MYGESNFFSTGFGVVVVIFLAILSLLWLILPLAIISIQKRVIELLEVNRKILGQLELFNKPRSDNALSNKAQLDPEPKIKMTAKCPGCGAEVSGADYNCKKCNHPL